MIAVICAMKEERDAFLKLMKDVKKAKGKKVRYHDRFLDNEYYLGTVEGKETVLCRCGVGEIYATISTTLMIGKYKPELIINLGCAGSLNENVHVNDIVIADRVASWRMDVPGWTRSMDSLTCSFPCEEKIRGIVKKVKSELNVHVGAIVTADEFIYRKSQVNEIRKHFPEALCGEMEGAAVAGTAYAFNVPVAIIRSISDETLVSGNYKEFDFNLQAVCESAAKLCQQIIRRY